MLCFTPESARQLVDALRATRPLLVHCGSIWVHRSAARIPVTEDEPRTAHADDVAQAFERAPARPAAIGSSFHVVSEQAMTLRGLADGVARWFGREAVIDLVD